MKENRFFLPITVVVFILFSCRDDKTIIDTSEQISGRNWSYVKKVTIPVKIANEKIPYNLYLNLRHTADYKYSNIFLLIHQTGPGGKKTTERKEFQLAYPDGEWLGSGAGNVYSYQIPFKENYYFPVKGNYIFELEQNMRDNPLHEITDSGLRVEKAD